MNKKVTYWFGLTMLLVMSLSLYFLFIKSDAVREVMSNIVFALLILFVASIGQIKKVNIKVWRIILISFAIISAVLWGYAAWYKVLWLKDLAPQLLAACGVSLVISYIFKRKHV